MPPGSRLLVRAALLHLVLGSSVGALLLAAKGQPGLALLSWSWRGAHVDMLLVGFILQFVLGVAHWILPRDHDAPPSEAPARACLLLLNAGVLAVAAGAAAAQPASILAGRVLELAGVLAFLGASWRRVRGVRLLPPNPGRRAPAAAGDQRRVASAQPMSL